MEQVVELVFLYISRFSIPESGIFRERCVFYPDLNRDKKHTSLHLFFFRIPILISQQLVPYFNVIVKLNIAYA